MVDTINNNFLPAFLKEEQGDAVYILDHEDAKNYFNLTPEDVSKLFLGCGILPDGEVPLVKTLEHACVFIRNCAQRLAQVREFYTYVICFVGDNLLSEGIWFETARNLQELERIANDNGLILVFLNSCERRRLLASDGLHFLRDVQPTYLQSKPGKTLNVQGLTSHLREIFEASLGDKLQRKRHVEVKKSQFLTRLQNVQCLGADLLEQIELPSGDGGAASLPVIGISPQFLPASSCAVGGILPDVARAVDGILPEALGETVQAAAGGVNPGAIGDSIPATVAGIVLGPQTKLSVTGFKQCGSGNSSVVGEQIVLHDIPRDWWSLVVSVFMFTIVLKRRTRRVSLGSE